MKPAPVLLTSVVSVLAACGNAAPETGSAAADNTPVAATLDGAGVRLDFAGGQGPCMIPLVTGTAEAAGWWAEPAGCLGVDYVEVRYLRPADGTEILFQPSYGGRLMVTELPPGQASALVAMSGAAGTGWFEGRPG